MLLLAIYKPPEVDSIDEIGDIFERLLCVNDKSIVLGDFNDFFSSPWWWCMY